jgi:Cysteine rich repeat
MFRRTIIVAATMMLVASMTPSRVQGRERAKSHTIEQSGTAQENAACRRDTRRLCRHIKAGEGNGAFLSCLQQHRAKLSKACKEVLESHGV